MILNNSMPSDRNDRELTVEEVFGEDFEDFDDEFDEDFEPEAEDEWHRPDPLEP